jgi:fatty acid synthase
MVQYYCWNVQVGDPEELNALADVFCKKRSTPLLVGSLKSNMGHSEPVAGLCSIVKLVIAMHTGYIPKNLHYDVLNPAVPSLLDGRIKVKQISLIMQTHFYLHHSLFFIYS